MGSSNSTNKKSRTFRTKELTGQPARLGELPEVPLNRAQRRAAVARARKAVADGR